MKSFKQYITELNTAGAGGVFGDAPSMGHGGSVGNKDFYAPGDARIPYIIGSTKIKGKKNKTKFPIQRRTPAGM
jgi:hypothetical protein